jgi:phosphoenolpyruvate synthase/pyruvate phosphate dikinase
MIEDGPATAKPPFCLQLSEISESMAPLMGEKTRNLAMLSQRSSLPIPSGYVIATNAFFRFIHFGIGRTGTFLMAYLIRQGLTMKAAEKALKKLGALPTRHCQWKMLRNDNKKVNCAKTPKG